MQSTVGHNHDAKGEPLSEKMLDAYDYACEEYNVTHNEKVALDKLLEEQMEEKAGLVGKDLILKQREHSKDLATRKTTFREQYPVTKFLKENPLMFLYVVPTAVFKKDQISTKGVGGKIN